MSVMAIERPSDYESWLRDELADRLELAHDGTRVEIIGGETVVSPGPDFAHGAIVMDISSAFVVANATRPGFSWRCIQTMDLNLSEIHDGYIPDLCVLDQEVFEKARNQMLKKLLPHHLAMVVEVTSRSNAPEDRRPGVGRMRPSKWNGYARVGIGYYLIVDRGPKVATATLYSAPDWKSGNYQESVSWKFGDTIELPEPFDVSVRTDKWAAWK